MIRFYVTVRYSGVKEENSYSDLREITKAIAGKKPTSKNTLASVHLLFISNLPELEDNRVTFADGTATSICIQL